MQLLGRARRAICPRPAPSNPARRGPPRRAPGLPPAFASSGRRSGARGRGRGQARLQGRLGSVPPTRCARGPARRSARSAGRAFAGAQPPLCSPAARQARHASNFSPAPPSTISISSQRRVSRGARRSEDVRAHLCKPQPTSLTVPLVLRCPPPCSHALTVFVPLGSNMSESVAASASTCAKLYADLQVCLGPGPPG